MTQLENVSHDITQQIFLLESVKKYGEELSSKGSTCEIARESSVLHKRVKELLTFEDLERSRDDISFIDVKFTTSALMTDHENVIGTIDVSVRAKGAYLFRKF